MITPYILIIVAGVWGGNVATTQEFNSKATCEAAKVLVVKSGSFLETVWARCVKK